MSAVYLTESRWMGNQNRTVTYIKWIDVERLLYNFRANHGLSTRGAAPLGGWDAPDFPFRTHMQGHYLTAWAHCYATLGDTTCRDRATYFVAELAKCQANNAAVGFGAGYLSGFPESEFTALEERTLNNGNVPYYAIHKTLAGLLDVWRHIGDTAARDVMLALAGWVDTRTGRLSYDQMQAMLGTEFGGMNDVLTEIYQLTGDRRWLTAAQRFDHASVFDPLASNRDELSGLHANTQVPKWIGAAREYRATGDARYRDIARNAWNMTVSAHTYAIGGNSQAEHFRPPNAIAQYLAQDTAEACNTYNMLKLTRELWMTDPDPSASTAYFDFYELALLNHLLGQQDPSSPHGHVTYFTPLNPGGRRGVGPQWGGGTWSTDHDSFWCCQGTGLETNTKLADSVYFRDGGDETLYVNLFTPSVLRWDRRRGQGAGGRVTVRQTTDFPAGDTTTLEITTSTTTTSSSSSSSSSGPEEGATFDLRIRIPAWVSAPPTITINGDAQPRGQGQATPTPGTYLSLRRTWRTGDRVTVRLPMALRLIPANDAAGSVAAVAYGPTVLAGRYEQNGGDDGGAATLPALDLGSLRRVGVEAEGDLVFRGRMARGGGGEEEEVELGPFYDAHGFGYTVYWAVTGQLPS
ncbi:hypothetical protein VTK26DRAFT_3454 [Humicola hyalothermophila]